MGSVPNPLDEQVRAQRARDIEAYPLRFVQFVTQMQSYLAIRGFSLSPETMHGSIEVVHTEASKLGRDEYVELVTAVDEDARTFTFVHHLAMVNYVAFHAFHVIPDCISLALVAGKQPDSQGVYLWRGGQYEKWGDYLASECIPF